MNFLLMMIPIHPAPPLQFGSQPIRLESPGELSPPTSNMSESGSTGEGWLLRLIYGLEPLIRSFLSIFAGVAVTLLQLSYKFVALACDHVQVVIGEFAPLLLCSSLQLLPLALNLVRIHR